MTWVAVAVTVGTTLVSMKEQSNVAKKQDANLAAQMRQQAATRRQVSANTNNLVAQEKASNPQDAAGIAKASYDKAIAANKAEASDPYQQSGATSAAFKKDAQDTALGVAKDTNDRSTLMANMSAPGAQRQDLQKVFDNYNISNNQMNNTQQGQNFLSNLKLQAIHANPWVSLLTNVGSAYARGATSGSGGGSLNVGDSSGVNYDPSVAPSTYYDGSAANSPWLKKVYG